MLHQKKAGCYVLILFLLMHLILPQPFTRNTLAAAIEPLSEPIYVYTATDLNDVRTHLSGHYIQMADINLGVSPWNEGAGWEPIGSLGSPFTGVYDGNGFTISNLTINRSSNVVGLFGASQSDSLEHFRDIHLVDVSVTAGQFVGGLVGNTSGPVVGCTVSGDVTGAGGYAGGLVGYASNTISHCRANVSVEGQSFVGGIAGWNYGNTLYCTSAGSVQGKNDYIGGICGYSEGQVRDCHSATAVSGQKYLGGLVGVASGINGLVENCSASGSVLSTLNSGTVSAVGGLIGWTDRPLKNSISTGPVTGVDEVGGLVGVADSSVVSNCMASGTVTGQVFVGGLIGVAKGLIQNSRAEGDVTGRIVVGGLVGISEVGSQIVACHASGDVTGYAFLGGLVGDAAGRITCSSATGNVTGQEDNGQTNCDSVGGLAGAIRSDCIITASHASGSASGNLSVGGLVGMSSGGSVRDSYAQGSVTGNSYLGGLVGSMYPSGGNDVSRCFSSGLIQPSPGAVYVGGLLGLLSPQVPLTDSYYDSILSGQTDTGKGEPRTTAQLIAGTPSAEIFTDWSMETWRFDPEDEYPWHRNNRPGRIPVERLAGANRYLTAVSVSKAGWPDCQNGADTVVLAVGTNFPDSLAGVTLANALDAPILLTTTHTLSASTRTEIERLGATRVIILGGTGAISADVADQVATIPGVEVERIAGDNRYDTAKRIAMRSELKYDTIFLASGLDFPDALSAAAYAARRGQPILLNGKTVLSASVKALLQARPDIKKVTVVGGAGAIADTVLTELTNLGVIVERISGSNRYETSLALANALWIEENRGIFLATGTNFPDALAGGVLAAKHNSGVLLVRSTAVSVPATIGTFIGEIPIESGMILGGVSAVTAELEHDLYQMLKQ